MTPRILSTLTIVKCSDGKYYQAVGDVFCPNIIETPLAGLVWGNDFEVVPEERNIKAANDPTEIIRIVCEYFRIDYEKLISKSRKSEVVIARQICMYYLKFKTKLSLKAIGEYFGGRDHTTAMWAIGAVVDLMDINDGMVSFVADLDKALKHMPNLNHRPVKGRTVRLNQTEKLKKVSEMYDKNLKIAK